eukprot:CAMPEP_0184025254 /NCGR_PEP_ID=MMETSP0954-20121128/12678_1 /TAXON_ID=627963 /ORGANISM="Aplanochytrium sp, Strain PBS07" /LENGTH=63 /DNA_ID=CAMNT_0026308957 /DNA_START=192 /DNA_END=380 /DNA_ORIENTATION=+
MEQKRMGINMMPCSSGTDMCDGCDAVISSTGIATISKLSLKDTEAQLGFDEEVIQHDSHWLET